MHNKLIDVFITVADCGSFSKAAKLYYCSTVSIMKQINQLEETLGVKLFHRTTQGVILTDAGQSIYQDAKKIISLSQKAINKAKQISKKENNTIRVGSSLLRPCKPLIDLLSTIDHQTMPFQIDLVSFDDRNIHDILPLLDKNFDCFIAPCGRTKWLEDFNVQHLRNYQCCIALSRSHKLANKKLLTWDDLDGESIFLIKQGESIVLDQIRNDIITNHPSINIIDSTDFFTLETFNYCEKKNYLIETTELWKDIHPALITIPVDWEYQIPYGIIYSKTPSPSLSMFIEMIAKTIEKG